MKVPQLTVGPNVRHACEPVHMGGCKYLRSTAQTCKEAKSESGQVTFEMKEAVNVEGQVLTLPPVTWMVQTHLAAMR